MFLFFFSCSLSGCYLFIYVCARVCCIYLFSSYGLHVIHTLFFSSSSLCFQGNTYGPLFSHFPMLDVREDSHPFSSFSGRKVGGEKNSKQLVFTLFTTRKIWYRNWFFPIYILYIWYGELGTLRFNEATLISWVPTHTWYLYLRQVVIFSWGVPFLNCLCLT